MTETLQARGLSGGGVTGWDSKSQDQEQLEQFGFPNQYFHEYDGELHVEDIPLRQLAEKYGTPLYVYSRTALHNNFQSISNPLKDFPHLICYAVKANSSLSVLNALASMGAGFDVVSGGELRRVMEVNGDPKKIVFSGPGKTKDELRYACEKGILCFNLESPKELEFLAEIAEGMGREANVAVRLNPGICAGAHPHIRTGFNSSKFGVDEKKALQMYRDAAKYPFINPIGIDCHIGSQINDPEPFLEALNILLDLHAKLEEENIPISYIDLGGGFGVRYKKESPIDTDSLFAQIREQLDGKDLKLILEPGRRITASAGVLLTRVLYLKRNGKGRRQLIVDAAMNDLLRPALYKGYHPIETVAPRDDERPKLCNVFGPACENGDALGKGRRLAAGPDDLLAIGMTGAYAFSMSSQYNARPRVAEVMVKGDQPYVIRERESFEDLIHGEHFPSE